MKKKMGGGREAQKGGETEQLSLVPQTHATHDTTGYVIPMKTWLGRQDASGSVELSLLLQQRP